MTDYLNFADLKTIIISIFTGVGTFFICVALQRYFSNRNIRSMKRRIEQAEAEKVKLDNLARSDRALIIHGFQGVFLMIAMVCTLFALQTAFFIKPPGEMVDARGLAQVLLWFLPALLCIGVFVGLQRVADYPKSIEKINDRITTLKNKLLGLGNKN
jgi:hypothetical protein